MGRGSWTKEPRDCSQSYTWGGGGGYISVNGQGKDADSTWTRLCSPLTVGLPLAMASTDNQYTQLGRFVLRGEEDLAWVPVGYEDSQPMHRVMDRGPKNHGTVVHVGASQSEGPHGPWVKSDTPPRHQE